MQNDRNLILLRLSNLNLKCKKETVNDCHPLFHPHLRHPTTTAPTLSDNRRHSNEDQDLHKLQEQLKYFCRSRDLK
ncbi:hypothetical protein J6590_001685 [Homalodisca vitripennis]|nr:hypothetical protein J6590_001685 [Homalodisca vitripennis]